MRDIEVTGGAATDPEIGGRPRASSAASTWAFKMTFEPESPLIDPEHLYRRRVFLLVSIATFALLVELALR